MADNTTLNPGVGGDDIASEDVGGVKYQRVKLVGSSTGATGGCTDQYTNALSVVPYQHHEIHAGSHYFAVGYQDLTSGQVLDFQWTMPNTTKWIHWTWTLDTEDEVNWLVYENAGITTVLANSFTPLNSNRNSANTSGTTMNYEVFANLAAANAKTSVGGATLLKSGLTKAGGFFVPGGGEAGRESELVMKQNTVYCMRAIANAAGFVNFDMEWYEHTNSN